jgi:endonuclease-3
MGFALERKYSSSKVNTQILTVIELLEKAHPDAKIALNYTNPLELLVATILSAQCTDERVNAVTKSLFPKIQKT